MGIRAAWVDDNRRTILRLDFEEHWTVGQMVDLLDGLRSLLEAAVMPLSLVLHHGLDDAISLTQATEVSMYLTPVFGHPNCRCVVVVGVERRLRTLYEATASQQTALLFADTLDEGYDLIRLQ